jgi:hypothetical protein
MDGVCVGGKCDDYWKSPDNSSVRNRPRRNVFVVDFGVNSGTLTSIETYSQSIDSSGYASQGYSFDAYVLAPSSPGFYQVVYNSGPLQVGAVGVNTFAVTPFNLSSGDLIAHYGQGIPLDASGLAITYYPGGGAPYVGEVIPNVNMAVYPGGRTYSIAVGVVPEPTTMVAGALLLLPFGMSTLQILRRSRMA